MVYFDIINIENAMKRRVRNGAIDREPRQLRRGDGL
jgi:hypothetical protein